MDRVAKYLRRTMKCKEATVKGEKLELFVGSKVVDALMESEWGGASRRSASGKSELAFPSRVSATNYCEKLLECGYFLRGWREEVSSSKDKERAIEQGDKGSDTSSKGSSKAAASGAVVQRKKNKKETLADGESSDKAGEKSSDKKTKKRFKVGFHEREDQFFEDSSTEIYIWQYNPPSWRSTAIGFGLLIVVVVFTMYPLWPDWSRIVAYYVSIALACLLGVLLLAELLRVVIFSGIWLSTWGRVHFMILPNLYEDVGFWDSFKPWYSLDYKGDDISSDDEEDENEEGESDSGETSDQAEATSEKEDVGDSADGNDSESVPAPTSNGDEQKDNSDTTDSSEVGVS